MRGRKPVPTELHKLRGTLHVTRHKRDRPNEPIADGDLMAEPPEWMTDSQQAGWRYAIDNAPRGLLKKIDRAVLAVWVEAEDRHRKAAMLLATADETAEFPLLMGSEKTGFVVSPYIGIMNRAAAILIKAGSELGFSPAARPRLCAGIAPPTDVESESPWERLQVIQGGKKTG